MATDRIECLPCMLRPLTVMAYLCLFPVIFSKCPHTCMEKGPRAEFWCSKRMATIVAIPVTIMATHIFWGISVLVTLTKRNEEIPILSTITDLLFVLIALFNILCTLLSSSSIAISLNGLIHIINKKKEFGIDFFFTQKVFKKVRWSLMIFTAIFITLTLTGTLYYTTLSTYVFDSNYKITRFLSIIVSGHFLACHSVILYTQSYIFSNLIKRCFDNIESILLVRNPNSALLIELTKMPSPQNIIADERLRRLARLYNAINFNFIQLAQFLQPSLIVWFSCILSIIIIDFYSTIVYGTVSYDDPILTYRSYQNIAIIIMSLAVIEDLNLVGNRMLTFLYRYPISKLTKSEADQIEMLIKVLHIRRPTIRASDIFTVGTRLLASISGTVVTYVLVALQFHASHLRKKKYAEGL